jgi:hypothetical protein
MSTNARCQSCGMPLKADPKGGGTNADGSLSAEYCSFCYQGGKFFNPDMTIDGMRTLIVEKLRERGYPRFIARFFTFGLGRLKRWR